jgi:hypothetical protein
VLPLGPLYRSENNIRILIYQLRYVNGFFTSRRNFCYPRCFKRGALTSNPVLTRARKAAFASQRDFGKAVAESLKEVISDSYAQKKASLWESGNLTPTREEMVAMSELLRLPLKDLQESFSGVLPYSTADLVRNLAKTQGEGLIAGCFAGRVRPRLLEEDEHALREAITSNVSMALFFPFPLDAGISTHEYAEDFTSNYREVWRTVVKFWKILRSFGKEGNPAKVRLYRPKTTGPNMVFPPMFHRPTLLCERVNGTTKIDLLTWTQGSDNDGFYKIGGRSIETGETQMEAWELYFGGVLEHWSETGELPEGDSYWQAHSTQSDTEGEQ